MKNKIFTTSLIVIGLFCIAFSCVLNDPVKADTPTWYNYNWHNVKKIIIDRTKFSSSLDNFPLLFVNTSNDFSHAQADGDDFIFVKDDNITVLNHEIESFTGNTLIAWVNVTVNRHLDNVIWLYYNNSGCGNQQHVNNVWDDYYILVDHLKDLTTSTTNDSTVSNYDGTKKGANEPIQTNGIIKYGEDFDGVASPNTDYIRTPSTVLGTGSKTISFWMNEDSVTYYAMLVTGSATGFSGSDTGINIGFSSTTKTINFYLGNGGTSGQFMSVFSPVLKKDVWYLVTCTYDGTTIKIYSNKTLSSSTTKSGSESAGVNNIMYGDTYSYNGYYPCNGTLDEMRFSNIARNFSYVNASYDNQLNPSTFYSISNELVPPPPLPPVYFNGWSDENSIHLNWTKGIGADMTSIYYCDSDFLPPYLEIYNWSNLNYNYTGLVSNMEFCFIARSWNNSSGLHSTTFMRTHDTTRSPIPFVNLIEVNCSMSYTDEIYEIPPFGLYYAFNVTGIGDLQPLHHLENIVNATGTHNHILNSTGYWIWANYTGNTTVFDDNDFILPIITTGSIMGIGLLMIKRRRKNES
jgi:hypothetical protein